MLSGFRFNATILVDSLVKKIGVEWDTIEQLQRVLIFFWPLVPLYVSMILVRLIWDLFRVYEYHLRRRISVPSRMSRWRQDWVSYKFVVQYLPSCLSERKLTVRKITFL
jgi:hypothetical protein